MGDVADKGAPGPVDLAALERAIGLHTRLIATAHVPTQRVSSTRTDIPKKAAMVGYPAIKPPAAGGRDARKGRSVTAT